MTIPQKLRFEAEEAKRASRGVKEAHLPKDKRGRVRKGINLADYQPNAPPPTLTVRLPCPVC